jgi:nicotinamidase-related amidase
MTSAPVRDPLADHLLTPQNAAFLLIDYQPAQLAGVRSMDRALLVKNAVSTVKTIKTFDVPVVHSTVNVATGRGQPTLPELAGLLTDDQPLDRTTVNSWEDIEFLQAVHATGRRKLLLCALWTEICMAFAALDALREGYEVYPVVDAIGGTSPEAHRAGLDRVIQAGGQPVSWVSLAVELQRDWARQDTAAAVAEIVLTDRLLKEWRVDWIARLREARSAGDVAQSSMVTAAGTTRTPTRGVACRHQTGDGRRTKGPHHWSASASAGRSSRQHETHVST